MRPHEYYMQHALALAGRASGCTSPNPLVGAVLVQQDSIVGEGWHKQAGLAHAEINAINNAAGNTKGATLYVTLEPCSHHGRTPPCTQAVIDAGISTVVFATADINPKAEGGAAKLRAAGIHVLEGVCEAQALHINRFFFHFQQHKRPYVVAKYASSLDGRIATRSKHSQWITGPQARHKAHQLRQAVDAIVIGSQTLIDDNPKLTVRELAVEQLSHPLRIVLDSRGRAPLSSHVFQNALPGSTVVATSDAMNTEHEALLVKQGVEVVRLGSQNTNDNQTDHARPNINELLAFLAEREVQSMMVEGGRTVLGEFFDHNCVDEVWAFIAPMIIGGEHALPSIGGIGIDKLDEATTLEQLNIEHLGSDILMTGMVSKTKATH